MEGNQGWKKRHIAMATVTLLVLAFGGCTRGCSCLRTKGDQTIGPDGQPRQLAELPGYKSESSNIELQAFDVSGPKLYGPYIVNQPIEHKMRVINKIGQAVNDAKVQVVAQHFDGDAKPDTCQVANEPEGVYRFECTYDRTGDWDMTITAEQGADKAKWEYQIFVRPETDAPATAPTSTPVPTSKPVTTDAPPAEKSED